MIEASWLLFAVASLVVIMTPGQDMLLVMSRSLGVAFAALTFLIKGPVGIFAGALSGWLRSRPGVLAWVYRSSGAILIGLGVRLAFERRQA